MYFGIDISDNQGVVDHTQVKRAGCQFEILRSVRRSGKEDYQFANNINGCRENDIHAQIYKYTYATTVASAIVEAQQVVALAEKYDYKGLVWWDVEDRDTLRTITKDQLTECILAAQQVIENAGLEFGIYTGEYVLREGWFDFSRFDCQLWGAKWPSGNPVTAFGHAPDASGKPDLGRELSGWQYCSKGRIDGIDGDVDLDIYYDPIPEIGVATSENEARQKIVDCAMEWIGCRELDGSHKTIIDMYNNYTPLPQGYKMKYTDSWCAAFVSAAAISAGHADIIPVECSCGRMQAAFQKMGRWEENDAYVPDTGDVIFYDWQDSGIGDNKGWPDHVGIVVSSKDGNICAIEGNKDDAVGYRIISVNAKGIRGYGLPDYVSKSHVSSPEASARSELYWLSAADVWSQEEAEKAMQDFYKKYPGIPLILHKGPISGVETL